MYIYFYEYMFTVIKNNSQNTHEKKKKKTMGKHISNSLVDMEIVTRSFLSTFTKAQEILKGERRPQKNMLKTVI